MNDIVVISIACATDAEAQTLARLLVEQALAACAQTYPVHSTYRWRGAIESADEVMLTAKTLAGKLEALEATVRANHSYEVPEILAVPIAWVSADYVEWLRSALA